MARLAIFIDGGYLDKLNQNEYRSIPLDYEKLASKIAKEVRERTSEPVDVLRTLYYNYPPYQGNPPTEDERRRYQAYRRFADALRRLRRFELREGRLAFRGLDGAGRPIFEQKRVDLLLGVDFALLSGKRQVSHIALLAGDSDLIPAVQIAKQEGVGIWLFHGPPSGRSQSGNSTFHQDLWEETDERVELTPTFMTECARAVNELPSARG